MTRRVPFEARFSRVLIGFFMKLGHWSFEQTELREDLVRFKKHVDYAGKMDEIELFADYPEVRSLAYYRWRVGEGRMIKRIFSKGFKALFPGQVNLYFWCDKIGAGFVPFHAFSTVISARELGRNVTIFHGVTIGHKGPGKCPRIGNNVTIYANACVIGDIIIGDNAVIGAGSVVFRDVPSGIVVAGNPAKKVKDVANTRVA